MIITSLLLGWQGVSLKTGITIQSNVKLAQGIYMLGSAENLKTPAVTIRGNNLNLDFKGVVLRGTPAIAEPDQRKGLGIRLSGKNIVIRNLKIHGYKVAVSAENCTNVRFENCDFSYNWKQKLASTPEKEDLSDWMSFHDNEKDEWLRYGAGLYLKNVNKFEVKGCMAVGGQCGVMMSNANNGLVWNSRLAYLSAIGVGMYRSSNNRIMHNSIDYCVRGYSHGVYNRGQDSAGILIYEQSHKNTFAYNSVTHGGDGFFLWAGKTTMDTGKGGCNDNVVFGNDFSYAPTNGVEATFSRNKFVNNRIKGCWHGFWTGYSYKTLIAGNLISDNEEGIAHEHGQDNFVDSNEFMRNKTDISIWANDKQDPNWGYPKYRDTKSRDWTIENNTFATLKGKTLKVRRTDGLLFQANTTFEASYDIDPTCTNMQLLENCMHTTATKLNIPAGAKEKDNKIEHMPSQIGTKGWNPLDIEDVYEADSPEPLKGGLMPFGNPENLSDRSRIIVDEWGPYDYRSPKILPTKVEENGWRKLSILGPNGKWKLVSNKGLETKSVSGAVPGSIWVRGIIGEAEQNLELEYVGAETTDYRGITTTAGKPLRFTYRLFDLKIDFDVHFFPWNKDTQDPRSQQRGYEQASVLASGVDIKTTKLDFAGYGKFAAGVPASYFGTYAKGTFTVKPGEYVLEVTGDDGIVVNVDEKNYVNAWKYQGPTLYTADLKLGGTHTITVHHFQIDGYAALQLKIKPKVRS
jgi:hypothetical protein